MKSWAGVLLEQLDFETTDQMTNCTDADELGEQLELGGQAGNPVAEGLGRNKACLGHPVVRMRINPL